MNEDTLIDELRAGMRARTDDTEVPSGFADDARRTAQRRSARRVAAAGTPLLAAAGVATVLATSGGSSSHGAQAPSVNVTAGQTHDTAYIVSRVKANIAADSQNGTAVHVTDYRTGQVTPDGTLINLGADVYEEDDYVTPDGTEYSHDSYLEPGSQTVETLAFITDVPGSDGHPSTDTQTLLNPRNHTYFRKVFTGGGNPLSSPTPTLFSSPSQVEQSLHTGEVTQLGTSATVDGTPAITLSVKSPSDATPQTTLVYVDAQNYQPLRVLHQADGRGHILEVDDWVPATDANIAAAKDQSIPAGYRPGTLQEVDR